MLHWMAREAITELSALGVVNITPDEIAELHDAARAVSRAEQEGGSPSGCGIPIAVGGVTLWPLTCVASDFWERATGWFTDGKMLSFAIAYAMAHGRKADAFDAFVEPRATAKVLRRFGRRLTCTMTELDRAIELVFAGAEVCRADEIRKAAAILGSEALPIAHALLAAPGIEKAEALIEHERKTWRSMVLDFCAVTGCSVSDWLIQPSAEVTRAYALALSTETARMGGGEDPCKHAVAEALGNLRRIIKRICISRKAKESPCKKSS